MLRLLITLALCAAAGRVAGQRCGLETEMPLNPPGETSYQIPVTGFFNNDLADTSQSVCNVEIHFQHTYVYGLSVTLFSPAGDSVQLIGPVSDQTRPPSTLVRWFIDFGSCENPAAPDPGAPERWDNRAEYDWPVFSTLRGRYHPAVQCLDTFDEGPVNGDWRLVVRNGRDGQQGAISFFQIQFCDDHHEEGPCCEANAGDFPEDAPTIIACENPFDLPVAPQPRYRRPRPDAAEYGYAYVLARNDSILEIAESINLAGLPAGSYEVCGLSYRLGELDSLPVDGSWSPGSLRASLTSSDPLFCADLATVCQRVLLTPPPDTTRLTPTICRSGFYEIAGRRFTEPGTYAVPLVSPVGCDSIVMIQLEVVDTLRTFTDTVICAGSQYSLGGAMLTREGNYVDTLTSYFGCDSIASVRLRVRNPIETRLSAAICAGERYAMAGELFATSGRFERTIPARSGCDSTIFLDLVVLEPTIRYTPGSRQLDCLIDTVTLDATPSSLAFATDFGWYDETGDLLARSLSIPVAQAGVYTFEVTSATRGTTCRMRDTVRVREMRFDPVAEIVARPQVPCPGEQEPCALITCDEPTLRLEVAVSPARPSYELDWSGPGGIQLPPLAAGRAVTASNAGRYRVTVVDTASSCVTRTTLFVQVDTAAVNVSIIGNELITCANPTIDLLADTTQPRADDLIYTWRSSCFAETRGGPVLSTGCPGVYSLNVRNTVNGCSRDTTFRVVADRSPVVLNLAPAAAPLTCNQPLATLAPSRVDARRTVEYSWTSDNLLDTLGTDSLLVTPRPGVARLTVTDPINGCSATATINVPDLRSPITAQAGPRRLTLDCANPAVTLGSPASSTGVGLVSTWRDLASPEVVLSDQPRLTVDARPGVYELSIINTTTGCEARDTVSITLDTLAPRIQLAQTLDFDCFTDSVLLRNTAVLPATPLHRWTGPCLPAEINAAAATAFCPGTYTYELTNQANGCASVASVEVGVTDNSVVAVLPDTVALNCTLATATIDATNSTRAPIARWFLNGRRIRLPGFRPVVNTPGNYQLVLANADRTCFDTATTVVIAPCPVFAAIEPPDSITCRNTTVTLNAGSSVPENTDLSTVRWLVPDDAVVLDPDDTRRLTVLSPGRFGVVITNLLTGQSDTSYVDVKRNQVNPVAEAGPTDTISCYRPAVTLDAVNSTQGELYEYFWTSTEDDTLSFAQRYTTSRPATYLLRVTQIETGCSRLDNVTVVDFTEPPVVEVTNTVIPCDSATHQLLALTDTLRRHDFVWSGPRLISGEDRPSPTVGAVGDYSIQVTRQDNGCTTTVSAPVTRAPCPPFPDLSDTLLTCNDPVVTLRPTLREPCVDCSYQWLLSGRPLPGATTSSLRVMETGRYEVVVTNTFGLQNTASAQVGDAREVPVENAGPDRFLTCADTEVFLWDGTQDTTYPFSYAWYGGQGVVLSEQPILSVRATGEYRLVTTNEFSGCSQEDTVRVRFDTLRPAADAGQGVVLNCVNTRRTLNGINSALGGQYTYQWRSEVADACISDANTLNPIVRCGGTYQLTVRDTTNGCSATDTVSVRNGEDLPAIVPLDDVTLNCFDPTAILRGGDTVGQGLTYRWARETATGPIPISSPTAAAIEVTEAGDYSFTVSSERSGCENGFTVRVLEDLTVPTVDAGPRDTFICGLDSLVLAATVAGPQSDLAYDWNSATGFAINNFQRLRPTVFQPDLYELTAINRRNGCRSVDSVLIVRDGAAPLVFAGRDTSISCARPQVQLFGEYSSDSTNARVTWELLGPGDAQLPQILAPVTDRPGRYQLNVFDPSNGCRGADVVTVTADTTPPYVSVLPGADIQLTCERPEVNLRVQSFETRPIDYAWFLENALLGADSVQVATDAGRYSVLATNLDNGCTGRRTVNVMSNQAPPQTQIQPPLPITCRRDSVTLRVADPVARMLYVWSNGASASMDSVAAYGPNHVVTLPGPYLVTARDPGTGCRDTTIVVVPADTLSPTIELAEVLPLNCIRTEVTLDAGTSDQGETIIPAWFGPAGFERLDPLRVRTRIPGEYRLDLSNVTTGCTASRSVTVERLAVAIDRLDIQTRQPICVGGATGEIQILSVDGGQGPYSFSVNSGAATDAMVYEQLLAGEYLVTATGSDGCSLTQRVTVDTPEPPRVSLPPDTVVSLGDSLTITFLTSLQNVDSVSWSVGGRPALDVNSSLTIAPTRTTTVALTVAAGDGCTAEDRMIVEVDERVNVYVPTAFSPNGDRTNDVLRPYLGTQIRRVLDFQVYNRWGSRVYELPGPVDERGLMELRGWDGRIGSRAAPGGVYAWRIALELVDGTRLTRTGNVTLVR